MLKIKYIFFLIYTCLAFGSVADNINALLFSLKECKNDSEKVVTYNSLAIELSLQFNYAKAKEYANLALALAKKINYQKGEYRAYINKGSIFISESQNDSARLYIHKALKMAKSKNNLQAMSSCNNLLGNIEEATSNINKALKYYLESLICAEKCNNQESIAIAYHNLAIVYDDLDLIDSSLVYNYKALAIRLKMNLHDDLAASYNNIGSVYLDKSMFDSSLIYFQKGLELRKKAKDVSGIAQSLGNIAICYKHKNDFTTAIKYYSEAIEIQRKINDEDGAMSNYINLSILYFDRNNYKDAVTFAQKALEISKKINNPKEMSYIHSVLYTYYQKIDKYKDALFNYRRWTEINDSLMNAEQIKETTRIQMNYQFDKQNNLRLIEQQKKDAETREIKNRQTMAILGISIGLLLVLVFTGIIFKSLQENKQKNKIITEQKKLVDEKNKEVLDSINYAQRIQQGILPDESELKSVFSESFVLFKPKNIVSGDFYWFFNISSKSEKKNIAAVVAADCTGHGVPGAFMSMLNSTLLNQTIYNPAIKTPSDALNFLNKELPKNLKSFDKSSTIRDGMDLAFCLIDLNKNILQFAGANNPCLIIRNNELKELKPLKQAITASEEFNKKQFTDEVFQLQKNDVIYLYTDGYADQFGGPKGKKFKYKELNELLLSISELTCTEQKEKLEATFMNWKGDLEQVDDVLIIGIKI